MPAKPAAKKAATKKPAAKKPAAKKPAAKKPVAKKPATGEQLRGVALVDAANVGRKGIHGQSPVTIARKKLGDRPLTPALARWLELDEDLFELGDPEPFMEMVEREFPEWGEAFVQVAEVLTGQCVLFEGWGCDSRRFLYLGTPDAHGELPVFTIDTDDTPFVCINGPVDVWLAQQIGYLDEESTYGHVPEAYEQARREHARLNFGGHVSFLDDAFHRELDPYA